MQLPKYHEAFIPVLEMLSKVDDLTSRELSTRVRDHYYSDLPKELLEQKTSTGANVLLDRILWAKSYLKMAKFVAYPKRGSVKITDKGRKALKGGELTLKQLQNDTDFINHREVVKSKKEDCFRNQTVSIIEMTNKF
jgi:restriction system protein